MRHGLPNIQTLIQKRPKSKLVFAEEDYIRSSKNDANLETKKNF